MRKILGLYLVLGFLFSFVPSQSDAADKISPKVLEIFDLPVYGETNKKISLKDSLAKYDKVVINIFAAWCTDCASKVPAYESAKKSSDPKTLYVALNAGDKEKKIQKFMDKNGLTGPVLLDEGKKVIKEMGVFGVPYVIIVQKDGTISYKGSKLP